MAEFCVDCWNDINGISDSEDKYILSKEYCLCEGCGELKRVIVTDKKSYKRYRLKKFLYPLYFLWRVILIPYTIYKIKKIKKKKDV